jgi:hypothetical protein
VLATSRHLTFPFLFGFKFTVPTIPVTLHRFAFFVTRMFKFTLASFVFAFLMLLFLFCFQVPQALFWRQMNLTMVDARFDAWFAKVTNRRRGFRQRWRPRLRARLKDLQ